MGEDLDIKRVTLTRDELAAIPEDERHLLVLLGYIANEVSILHKYLLWTIRMPEEQGPEHTAHLVSTGFLLRTLAGKLNESNNVIRRDYYNSGVSQRWGGDIPDELEASLKSIKKYFRGECLIKEVRNWYAFHYPEIDVAAALEEFDDSFDIYFAEANGNCLYHGPETVAMVSLLIEKVDPDLARALDRLSAEIVEVSRWVLSAANNFVLEIFRRNGLLDRGVELEELVIRNAPELDSVCVPYFLDPGRRRKAT